jgi:hypothetical protein
MRSVPVLRTLMLCLACSWLTACGTPMKAGPDAGPVDSFPADSTYWGLADQECFHYLQTSPTPAFPGAGAVLAFTLDTETVGGVTTYKAVFSGSLGELWTDWFGFTDHNLVLYRQHQPAQFGGTGDAGVLSSQDTYLVYTPAPLYLVKDLSVGNAKMSMTSAMLSTASGSQTDPQTFTINVLSSSPIMADMQMALMATDYVVTITDGTNMTSNQVWFSPQIGIVQLIQPSSTGDVTYTLSSVSHNVAAANCSP